MMKAHYKNQFEIQHLIYTYPNILLYLGHITLDIAIRKETKMGFILRILHIVIC